MIFATPALMVLASVLVAAPAALARSHDEVQVEVQASRGEHGPDVPTLRR